MVNQRGFRVFDKKKSEILGKPLFDLLPEGNSHLQSLLNDILKTGKAIRQLEFPVVIEIDRVPETIYFNVVFRPLKDENDKTTGITIVADDVSESVRLKHILRESEKQFRKLIMESSITMAIYRGENLIIELANSTMLHNFMMGRKEEDVIGRGLFEAFPELKDQKYPEPLREVIRTG